MPEATLLHGFKEFATRNQLIRRADKLVVAVSGGLDSAVLLDLVTVLRDQWDVLPVIAHFNHQLRGSESELDEQFVRSLAQNYGIECYVETADVEAVASAEHRSVQEAARNLRYQFLANLRESLQFQSIATAHHSDDNLETILFNLFRGSGVHGLTGIPRKRHDLSVVRPLLFATRAQIAEYAKEHSLAHREDSTNAHTDYSRNYIRHELLPLIRERINPNLTSTISRMAELFTDLETYTHGEVREILPGILLEQNAQQIVLDREHFLAQPVFLQESLLRELVNPFTKTEVDFLTVKALLNVSKGESGGKYSFPDNVIFHRDHGRLILERAGDSIQFSHRVSIEEKYQFERFGFATAMIAAAEYNGNRCIEYIDADKLGGTLRLRNWQHGDRFVPLGMTTEKKLSDFFIDAKVPVMEKATTPILESDGVIVWVCGNRIDERFKVTAETKNILRMEYTPVR